MHSVSSELIYLWVEERGDLCAHISHTPDACIRITCPWEQYFIVAPFVRGQKCCSSIHVSVFSSLCLRGWGGTEFLRESENHAQIKCGLVAKAECNWICSLPLLQLTWHANIEPKRRPGRFLPRRNFWCSLSLGIIKSHLIDGASLGAVIFQN